MTLEEAKLVAKVCAQAGRGQTALRNYLEIAFPEFLWTFRGRNTMTPEDKAWVADIFDAASRDAIEVEGYR